MVWLTADAHHASRHGGKLVVLHTLPYTNGSVNNVVTTYASLVECATP